MTLTAIRTAMGEALRALPKEQRENIVRRLGSSFKRHTEAEAKLREAVEVARDSAEQP